MGSARTTLRSKALYTDLQRFILDVCDLADIIFAIAEGNGYKLLKAGISVCLNIQGPAVPEITAESNQGSSRYVEIFSTVCRT